MDKNLIALQTIIIGYHILIVYYSSDDAYYISRFVDDTLPGLGTTIVVLGYSGHNTRDAPKS